MAVHFRSGTRRPHPIVRCRSGRYRTLTRLPPTPSSLSTGNGARRRGRDHRADARRGCERSSPATAENRRGCRENSMSSHPHVRTSCRPLAALSRGTEPTRRRNHTSGHPIDRHHRSVGGLDDGDARGTRRCPEFNSDVDACRMAFPGIRIAAGPRRSGAKPREYESQHVRTITSVRHSNSAGL